MEGISVPSFARGLNILLVDHDAMSLMYLASLLEQYSFEVTTTEVASLALSMICEQEDRFKLVIANMNMPDMDGAHSFLRILLKKDIPFILMSSERDVNAAGRALAEGACYFLEKPIFLEDLKHVWQHVYRKRGKYPMKKSLKASNNEGKVLNIITKESQGKPKTKEAGFVMHGHGIDRQLLKRANDDGESKQQEKRSKFSSEEIERKDNNKSSTDKKSRYLWSSELHLKFTAALSALGDKNAQPKKILKMMNVPNLTLRQVASHLQKYKAQVHRINETGVTNLPSVSKSYSPYDRTEIAQSHKKQIFLPSQLEYESSNFGTGGNTTQFPPNFVPNYGEWYPDHSLDQTATFGSEIQNQFSGTTKELQCVEGQNRQITPSDATNLEEFLIDFNNEIQEMEAITGLAPPACSLNQNQPLIEYDNLLKELEQDPEDLEFYAFGSEPNPDDVDRYCEWLRETLGENVTNPEQFEL